MIDQFYDFNSVLFGIMQLFVIISIGFFLFRKNHISAEGTDSITKLLVNVALPCMIFINISKSFNPAAHALWWTIPIASILMTGAAFLISFIVINLFKIKTDSREVMLASGFQNCVYLPVALIVVLSDTNHSGELLSFVFLFSIGFNLAVWSFSIAFLKEATDLRLIIKNIFNAPALATIGATISVLIFGNYKLPELISNPVRLLGQTAFPLALILLGASLAQYKGYRVSNIKAVSGAIATKLFLLPLATLATLYFLPLELTYKFILMLEAVMPTAVTLIIIGKHASANNRLFSGLISYSHLIALATIPAWLILFSRIIP